MLPSNANIFGHSNRVDQQPSQTATSFKHDKKCLNASKKLVRSSSFGCKDKIYDAKREFNNNNNKESDVVATVSQRDPFNNRNIVDSTNRSTSESV